VNQKEIRSIKNLIVREHRWARSRFAGALQLNEESLKNYLST